jgi:four helix bundle protein
MNPRAQEILKRIKRLVKLIVKIVDDFPKTISASKIGGQIVDAITSVGANFVEAQSARSKKEFVSLMGIVLKETKETIYWLEIIEELNLTSKEKIDKILSEVKELAKIFASIIITSSRKLK